MNARSKPRLLTWAGVLAAALLSCACETNPTVGTERWATLLDMPGSDPAAFFHGDTLVLADVDGIDVLADDGSHVWARGDRFRLEAIEPLAAGELLVSGWTNPDGEEDDRTWVVRHAANGDETSRIEHTGLIVEQQLATLADGGYVLSGNAYQSATLIGGTSVTGWFVAAFDGDVLRWIHTVPGRVTALRVNASQELVFVNEPDGGDAVLVSLDQAGSEAWRVAAPPRARLGVDGGGRWLVQGFGELAVVAAGGLVAWRVTDETIYPPFALTAVPRADSQGRIAVATDTGVRCFDAAGTELWHTPALADGVFDVAPAPGGGWLAAGHVHADLGYAVSYQDRLYAIGADGDVGEPERFRGGSIFAIVTDDESVRILGRVSSELEYGPGTLRGNALFVLARDL